jgi:hypothetical protein
MDTAATITTTATSRHQWSAKWSAKPATEVETSAFCRCSLVGCGAYTGHIRPSDMSGAQSTRQLSLNCVGSHHHSPPAALTQLDLRQHPANRLLDVLDGSAQHMLTH